MPISNDNAIMVTAAVSADIKFTEFAEVDLSVSKKSKSDL
jgi:hypothetical protein